MQSGGCIERIYFWLCQATIELKARQLRVVILRVQGSSQASSCWLRWKEEKLKTRITCEIDKAVQGNTLSSCYIHA